MQRKKKRYDPAADRAFLVASGLEPPPTDSSIRDMAVYIRKGGLPFGSTQASRIHLLKEAQEHWIGKRVRYRSEVRKQVGTVRYIRARSRGSVRFRVEAECDRQREYGGPRFGIAPIELAIKWDDDPITRLESTMSVEIIA